MQNRRVLPPLFKAKEDPDRRDDQNDEAKDMKAEGDATRKPDDPTEKSYTADEITVAQLLKGHPQAQELLDLLKSPVVGGVGSGGKDPGEVRVRNETSGALSANKKQLSPEQQAAMTAKIKASTAAIKSEGEDTDIEKAEDVAPVYTLEFSGDILKAMGLEKAKNRNESGEEFQDGSEDTIGGEGHAAPGRPGTIKHEGGGEGPDNPGTKTKKESQQKSISYDDLNVAILLKSSPYAAEILDSLIKAETEKRDADAAQEYRYNAWKNRSDKRSAKWKSGIEATKRAVQHFKNKADDAEGIERSQADADLEKSHSSRVGNSSPTKGAAGRHFAREAAEDQKKEDAKYRVPRHDSVLGSGGEVTNVSDKVVRVRPAQGGTIGSEAKIVRSWVTSSIDLHKSLDAILEKARRASWDPKPKEVSGEDKDESEPGALSGSGASRDHEYKRKTELADAWQKKKNSPEFRAASGIKD
jgi:hypothetical protein